MRNDFHSEKFRQIVTDKAVKKYRQRVELHRQGDRQFYRNRKQREVENKSIGRREDKTRWFRKKGYQGVLKVPMTERSSLANKIKLRLNRELPDIQLLIQEEMSQKYCDKITNFRSKWNV